MTTTARRTGPSGSWVEHNDSTDTVARVEDMPLSRRLKAARIAASRAVDAAELARFLDMLGIDATQLRPAASVVPQ